MFDFEIIYLDNIEFNRVYFHLYEISNVVGFCFVVLWHNSPVQFTSGNGIFDGTKFAPKIILQKNENFLKYFHF